MSPTRIHITRHEAIPDCGSFEVAFPNGRESVYFYFEDNPGRRLRPEVLTRAQALEQAQQLAHTEQDKLDGKAT